MCVFVRASHPPSPAVQSMYPQAIVDRHIYASQLFGEQQPVVDQ